jgi:chorismate dehydratase
MLKTKVGAVSYLNTKPLIYGFEQGWMQDEITLIKDYPSEIAAMLVNQTIEVGLVPVAVLPQLLRASIISDYCIGCEGAVASVALFSQVPIAAVTEVWLDYQSKTSVLLTKLLLKEYWKIQPLYIEEKKGKAVVLNTTSARLVIGDRAFEERKKFVHCYDLGEAWYAHTGLPFVFAVWASRKKCSATFINNFNSATGKGLAHLPAIAAANPHPFFDTFSYFTKYISYLLTDQKQKGLTLFLKKIQQL